MGAGRTGLDGKESASVPGKQVVSILMPVYNERYRAREAIEQVLDAPLPAGLRRRLVVVDDGSTDGTRELLRDLAAEFPETITLIEHTSNRGKGAALRTAVQAAEGDYAILQDADLEYDPQDYPLLLAPLLNGQADAVFGSRFAARTSRRVLSFWHTWVNRFLTWLSNVATNLDLTDMATGCKAFRLEILKSIPLRCDRFGMEAEITAKAAKRGLTVYEVPVSYYGRTRREGKKVRAWDAVKAMLAVGYYWLVDDLYEDRYGHAILHRLSGTPHFNGWMADTIQPFVGDRVLEIGGGLGNLTGQLLPRDQYTVSDIDNLHLRYLASRYARNPRVRVRRLDLTEAAHFEAQRGRYDTVVCLNVLEHVADDEAALRNMYAALEPGGQAVVLVPRGAWLYGSLDEVLGHHRRYSREELSEKARAAGFEVAHLFDFNRVTVPGWYANAVLLKRKHFGRLQLKVFDSLVGVLRRVDRWLPWQGASLIAVLRRPAASRQALVRQVLARQAA
jgi:glycosyltransferase involved in cell wall biosynthesis